MLDIREKGLKKWQSRRTQRLKRLIQQLKQLNVLTGQPVVYLQFNRSCIPFDRAQRPWSETETETSRGAPSSDVSPPCAVNVNIM